MGWNRVMNPSVLIIKLLNNGGTNIMKSTKLLRATAVAVLGLSLGATVASASPGTGVIDTTGPNSHNEVVFNGGNDVDLDNDNKVDVDNDTDQDADTGDAEVKNNTTGGDATSGAALNDNMLTGEISISNTNSNSAALGFGGNGDSEGTITNTGPSSWNEVVFNNGSSVDVDNDNDVYIDNNTDQNADSGDAEVENNTTGGDATSGDATNVNTTSLTITISN
jgi:hypothetical protein